MTQPNYTHKNNISKSGVTTGLVAVATLLAMYLPGLKTMPPELTIPAMSGLLNIAKNIAVRNFKFLGA